MRFLANVLICFVIIPNIPLPIPTALDACRLQIEAHVDPTIDRKPSFTINTLIGKRDEPVLTLCARQIIQEIR